MTKRSTIGAAIAGLVLVLGMVPAAATNVANPIEAVGSAQHLTLIDKTRGVKASNGFAGSETRRIDVTIWTPAGVAPTGGWPLVIYSHGSYGRADDNMHLVNHLVRAGYLVVAPDYPLSSRAAYTKIKGIDIGDVGNQTKDIHFILDQLLGSAEWSKLIDPAKIATIGHSLGAVTNYFTSFGSMARDPRIKATVLTGAGDPVQAALAANMGLIGNWNEPSHVPVLFLSGEHDAFALINGGHHTAYSRVSGPKYEIMIKGGVHIWFRDATTAPADGSNPDCAMLGGFRPGSVLAGCEPGAKLTTPARQQAVTRTAVLDFLDGHLRGDKARIKHLRGLPKSMRDVTLHYGD